MVLPVRWWPAISSPENTPAQLAHTVDINPVGGRLGGLREQLSPGQTILLQRGKKKAQFRVIWSKQVGPTENQAGIESLEQDKTIWGIDLSDKTASTAPPTRLAPAASHLITPVRASRTSAAGMASKLRRWRVPWLAGAVAASVAFAALAAITLQSRMENVAPPEQLVKIRTAPEAPTVAKVSEPKPVPRFFTFSKDSQPDTVSPLYVSDAPEGRPAYPVTDDSQSGRVDLRLVIGPSGRVRQVEVLHGKASLVESAVQAVKFWHYAPRTVGGKAVELVTTVSFLFKGEDAVSIRYPDSKPTPGAAKISI